MDHKLNYKLTPLLDECARLVMFYASRSKIPLKVLLGEVMPGSLSEKYSGYHHLHTDCDDSPPDSTEPVSNPEIMSLQGEIFLFISRILPHDLELQSMLLDDDGRGFSAKAADRFIQNFKEARRTSPRSDSAENSSGCIDEEVTKWSDPFRIYYRQLRQNMHNGWKEGVLAYRTFRHKGKDIPCISILPNCEKPILPHSFEEGEYKGWPCPDISQEAMGKKKYHIETALCYLTEAGSRFGEDYFIPVKELARYIYCHFPALIFSLCHESSLEYSAEGNHEPVAFEEIISIQGGANHLFRDPQGRLMQKGALLLAHQCSSALTRKEKILITMAAEKKPLREMAVRFGYSAPSGASAALEKAKETVRRFWQTWGADSGDDSELLTRFMKSLFVICRRECRNNDQR